MNCNCNEQNHLSCCCGRSANGPAFNLTRRSFMAGCSLAAGTALAANAAVSSETQWEGAEKYAPKRKPLIIKPVLIYDLPRRREATSWRNWGAVQTPEAAREECGRIEKELSKLAKKADFPITVLPVSKVRSGNDVNKINDLKKADVSIAYAAGGWSDPLDRIVNLSKNTLFFLRHRSGPLYLWYEIISPRYLRSHYDTLKQTKVDFDDVVIDEYEDLAVRLRALCGVKNTFGTNIVCIGSAGGWGPQARNAPEYAKKYYKLNLIPAPYSELKHIINDYMSDSKIMARARKEAERYLSIPGTTLECKKEFVERAFVLYYIFRDLMAKSNAPSITVNACMGTIIQQSRTTACLPLQLLNDQGFPSFCESDFVVIPAGLLLQNICNTPVFLNNPTYPHHGIITQAHCTGPRMMNGKDIEPARILTHFESDYGAAPKVERKKGQVLTNINADFSSEKYILFRGKVQSAPFLPICRDQMEIEIDGSWKKLRDNMRGFHWMTAYGDWREEIKYALKKIGIATEDLTEQTA